MKRTAALSLLTALALVGCFGTVALAQDDGAAKPRPLYLAIPPHSYYPIEPPATS
jgi:hypothetical protein